MFKCDTWYSNSEKTIWSGFQHLICYKCIASVVLIGFFCINIIPILNLSMFCNWFHKRMVFWGGRGRKVYLNEGEGKRKRGGRRWRIWKWVRNVFCIIFKFSVCTFLFCTLFCFVNDFWFGESYELSICLCLYICVYKYMKNVYWIWFHLSYNPICIWVMK